MRQSKVAVIGSGISGLSAAWALAHTHDVTLFEADARPGGHANTVEVNTSDGPVAVDTGFIVYNEANYPNLTGFFRHLHVPTAASEMSFALSTAGGGYEYCTSTSGFFDQARNLVSRQHWRLFSEMRRFFKTARHEAQKRSPSLSLGAFLREEQYDDAFTRNYILPMGAAIWSSDVDAMLEFPARSFIQFYANHGLLGFTGQRAWRTVLGGSQEYVTRVLAHKPINLRTDAPVVALRRNEGKVDLRLASGEPATFDQVVLATHANTSLNILDDADPEEAAVLGAFGFQDNVVVLHKSDALMPKRKRLWSSWNYRRAAGGNGEDVSLTYWMNRLQPLACSQNIFVTLNPTRALPEDEVIASFSYSHPLFTADATAAQSHMPRIQGRGGVWHAGAWLGYGFHEDGVEAGLAVAEAISPFQRPWDVPAGSQRIAPLEMPITEAAE